MPCSVRCCTTPAWARARPPRPTAAWPVKPSATAALRRRAATGSGATATLRSLSKADYRLAPGGAALNLRLFPGHFEGEEGLNLLTNLLQTYFGLGGEQLQVNMVSAETLRRAMQTPDEYRDLVVRVAGFHRLFCQPDARAASGTGGTGRGVKGFN